MERRKNTGASEQNNTKPPSGGWGYENHVVKCPSCGKDILDHMTECPFCKSAVEPQGAKPISEDTARRMRLIVLIAGIVIALLIIVPILLNKFGG